MQAFGSKHAFVPNIYAL